MRTGLVGARFLRGARTLAVLLFAFAVSAPAGANLVISGEVQCNPPAIESLSRNCPAFDVDSGSNGVGFFPYRIILNPAQGVFQVGDFSSPVPYQITKQTIQVDTFTACPTDLLTLRSPGAGLVSGMGIILTLVDGCGAPLADTSFDSLLASDVSRFHTFCTVPGTCAQGTQVNVFDGPTWEVDIKSAGLQRLPEPGGAALVAIALAALAGSMRRPTRPRHSCPQATYSKPVGVEALGLVAARAFGWCATECEFGSSREGSQLMSALDLLWHAREPSKAPVGSSSTAPELARSSRSGTRRR
jgi:hypothetical protein